MKVKERFINACLNKEVDRPPVWMMRQAGRYLPEYRAIKEHHPTKEMMQNPELACEITLQPLNALGVDALILYSDILMIPDAMGMALDFAPGEGPVFGFAVNEPQALGKLETNNVQSRLTFVPKTIELILSKIPEDIPLLGFAGAPFTVACYMISGGHKKDFTGVKRFAWEFPKEFDTLMNLLADTTIDYLIEQAHAGVTALQLFDTWAGLLSPKDYETLAKPYTEKIFKALRKNYIPSIHYIKDGSHLLDHLSTMSSDCIGVDWRVDLSTIKKRTDHHYSIQGNFDPDILLTTPELIKERVGEMLSTIDDPKKGYIVNLGHGINKDTPVANAKMFVETAQNFFK